LVLPETAMGPSYIKTNHSNAKKIGLTDYFSVSAVTAIKATDGRKLHPLMLIYKQMKIKHTTGKGRFLQDTKPCKNRISGMVS